MTATDVGDAYIVVQDQGIGIAAAERDLVTQRFFRGGRARAIPGAGLGLSLVSAIVALHRARLVISDCAPGTAMRIVFPP